MHGIKMLSNLFVEADDEPDLICATFWVSGTWYNIKASCLVANPVWTDARRPVPRLWIRSAEVRGNVVRRMGKQQANPFTAGRLCCSL